MSRYVCGMASSTIPDELKADLPQTKWGKVLGITPVVLTVIATLLAGLSNGEMSRAQYERSLAAQQQSKAGDQWGLFQAKRLRGSIQRSTLDALHGQGATKSLSADALAASAAKTDVASPAGRLAAVALASGELPKISFTANFPGAVTTALKALEQGQSDAEVALALAALKPTDLDAALRLAHQQVTELDAQLQPVNRAIDTMERTLTGDALSRDFLAARLSYSAQRYDTEARFNQIIANLHELQVRSSNLSADRHHRRSQRFFYGMLAAQTGVIMSTFAMAARKKNLLWSVAAAAGVAAVSFATYVYLFV